MLKVGDKVRLNPNKDWPDFAQEKFERAPGVIVKVLTEWEPGDIICWDVHVKTTRRGRVCINGFHFDDLEKV